MGSQARRLKKRAEAAEFLENNADPVMRMLADVVNDLAEENEGLSQFAQDMNLAMELGWRIDQLFHSSDPLVEALDGPIGALIALGAIGIWRLVARTEKLRGQRVEKLKARLQAKGPQMAKLARTRLARRIKRLEAK